MGVKISAVTPAVSVAGTELVPVSQSGTPRSVTVDQVKDYAIDQIEAIAAGTTAPLTDKVFILQGGDIKPVDLSVVAQSVIDSVWAKADQATPADANKLALKDGSTEKTVTLTGLAAYVQTAIRAAVLNPATLDAAGATADADLFVIGQAGAAKKITLATVNAAIYAGLSAHVSAQTASSGAADTDVFYNVTDVGVRKTTLAQIKTAIGAGVTPPAATTENHVPQWNTTAGSGEAKALKNGVPIVLSTGGGGAGIASDGSDSKLASEKAIRDAIDDSADVSELIYNRDDINADLDDGDMVLVNEGDAGPAHKKSAVSRLWTYIWAKFTGATAKATPIDADSIAISDSAALDVVKKTTLTELWTNWLKSKVEAIAEVLTLPNVSKTTPTDADELVLHDAAEAGADKFKALTLANLWTEYLSGKGVQLGETEATAYRGDRGATGYQHSQSAHAPANAQKNSDVTKTEIEVKLTGTIDTHTHAGLEGLAYKGVFADEAALIAEIPTGEAGWFATVLAGEPAESVWYWDPDGDPNPLWVNSGVGPLLQLGETDSTAHRGDHGKAAYDHSQVAHAPANAQAAVAGINLQTGTTYTLTLADAGKLVRCSNAADVVVTIPPNAAIDYGIGTVITIEQAGAGTVTVAGAGGVTTHSNDGEETAGQYAAMQIIQITTDEWVVYGGVTNV